MATEMMMMLMIMLMMMMMMVMMMMMMMMMCFLTRHKDAYCYPRQGPMAPSLAPTIKSECGNKC